MYRDRPQKESPLKAIKEHCKECMDNLYEEIRNCPGEGKCQLWPFRFGKNPYRQPRELTEEQKDRLVSNIRKRQKREKDED